METMQRALKTAHFVNGTLYSSAECVLKISALSYSRMFIEEAERSLCRFLKPVAGIDGNDATGIKDGTLR